MDPSATAKNVYLTAVRVPIVKRVNSAAVAHALIHVLRSVVRWNKAAKTESVDPIPAAASLAQMDRLVSPETARQTRVRVSHVLRINAVLMGCVAMIRATKWTVPLDRPVALTRMVISNVFSKTSLRGEHPNSIPIRR